MKILRYFLCGPMILMMIAAQAQKKDKTPPPPPPLPLLDINKPEDAMKANRKITSSLKDGESCYYYWQGNVYSPVPGEKDRLLFTYIAMNTRAKVTASGPVKGYDRQHVSRELLFYQDPKTGEILKTWENPWTGQNIDVYHIANDPVNGRGPSYGNDGKTPYKLAGFEKDGYWFQLNEVPLFYTNPLGGDFQDEVGGTYQAMEIFQTITHPWVNSQMPIKAKPTIAS